MSTPDKMRPGLSSKSEEDRRAAVLSLRDNSDTLGLRLLEQALGDESWRVRKAAVEVIKDFPDRPRVFSALMSALEDEDNAGRRNAAVEAFVSIKGMSADFLAGQINHSDQDVKKFVVDILGEIGSSSSINYILPLTKDPLENIRLAAVEAIGTIGGDKAYSSLLAILSGNDVSLQFAVLHALSRIGKPIPIDTMKPLLEKKILRRAIYDALGHTKSNEAISILADGLLEPSKSPRQAAVRALHRLSADKALKKEIQNRVRDVFLGRSLDPIAGFMEGNLLLKKATVSLLGLIATPAALDLLLNATQDDSIQVDVKEAILNIKEKDPVETEPVIKSRKSELTNGMVAAISRPMENGKGMIGPMSDDQFMTVRNMVSEECGLHYDSELKYLVERRVQRRMESSGMCEYGEYLNLLSDGSPQSAREKNFLINVLSTNETYFFREEFQLRAFREEIIPIILESRIKKGDRNLRIWSAGCSSGEEPYTIAMILKECSGLEGFNIEIIGTDINERMVDIAKSGIYGQSSFRSTPDEYVDRYFKPKGSKFKISDSIMRMVRFERTNLLRPGTVAKPGYYDVIFCRNVIIYFNTDSKRKVVNIFHHSLVPGGYLLLGHSESLMSISTDFELAHLKNDLVYRKGTGGAE